MPLVLLINSYSGQVCYRRHHKRAVAVYKVCSNSQIEKTRDGSALRSNTAFALIYHHVQNISAADSLLPLLRSSVCKLCEVLESCSGFQLSVMIARRSVACVVYVAMREPGKFMEFAKTHNVEKTITSYHQESSVCGVIECDSFVEL